MDVPAILGVLNDLPDTFTRIGPPYTQFIDSLAAAKALYTLGADQTMSQAMNWNNGPVDGWLDTWGLLFGLPRQNNEGNNLYAQRLYQTMTAWVGTYPAVVAWMNLFAAGGNVVENLPPAIGYALNFPATMTIPQIQAWLVSFQRIRPVGVPFTVNQISAGLVLDTDAFMDLGSRIAGDYLVDSTRPLQLLFGPTTLSAKTLLPTYLLYDTILNPGLIA